MKDEYITALIKDGYSAANIVSMTAIPRSTVYLIAKRNGLRFAKEYPGDDEVIRLYNEGLNYTDIARKMGKDPHNMRKTCIRLGLAVRTADRIPCVIDLCNSKGFEYLDGYVTNTSDITVKCKTCGNITIKNYQRFLGNPVCDICEKHKRAERNQKAKEAVSIKRRQKMLAVEKAKLIRMAKNAKQLEMKVCPVCNGLFVRKGKYCSDKCADRVHNRTKEHLRRVRINCAEQNRDITLEKLFRRDNGVCYLCGKLCDWNDKIVRDETVICGNNYPSIDHVIPLARGGAHTWNNVRLAHRICNSIKGYICPPSTNEG